MSQPIPKPNEEVFPNPLSRAIALATITKMADIHESVITGARLFHSQVFTLLSANPEAFVEFHTKFNEESLSNRFVENIDYAISLMEGFNNKVVNGGLNRYDYDLFMMNYFIAAQGAISLTRESFDLVVNNFVIQIDNALPEDIRQEFVQILNDTETEITTLVQIYGALD